MQPQHAMSAHTAADPAQIRRCQAVDYRIGYGAWVAACEARAARGETQVWCATCQRWQWRAELCAAAVVDETRQALEE